MIVRNRGRNRITVVFEIATGIVKHVLYDNAECTQAFSHSATEIYLITNNISGNSIIGNLNMTTLNYNLAFTASSKITSTTLLDADNLIFSTANGNITQYTYSNGSAINISSGAPSNKLYYSSKFNKLYSAQGKNLVE